MPIEIRELIVKAILDNEGEKEATEQDLERVLPEEYLKKAAKKKKGKAEVAADGKVREEMGEKLPEGDFSWEDADKDEEEGEDEFMDSRESIIQECMDRVKQYLENQLMR
jgi:hypothetical protein